MNVKYKAIIIIGLMIIAFLLDCAEAKKPRKKGKKPKGGGGKGGKRGKPGGKSGGKPGGKPGAKSGSRKGAKPQGKPQKPSSPGQGGAGKKGRGGKSGRKKPQPQAIPAAPKKTVTFIEKPVILHKGTTPENDLCSKSKRIQFEKSVGIPCFPNLDEQNSYMKVIKNIDSTMRPSYTWDMPESLTPQNTEKDISGKGFGKITIPKPQPENSGMLKCQVTVLKDGLFAKDAKHKTFEHHILVTRKAHYSYKALYGYILLGCQNNKAIKAATIASIGKALCHKKCAGSVQLTYCKEDELIVQIAGPPLTAKGLVDSKIKQMKAFLKQNVPKIYAKLEEKEAAIAMKMCPIGYSLDKQLSDCLPCRPGTYSTDGSKCLPCPVGQFQDVYGSTSCNSCVGSYTLSYTGASRIQECYSTTPPGTKRPPESCDYWDSSAIYTTRETLTSKTPVQLKEALIASLKLKMKDIEKPGERAVLSNRIKEIEREKHTLLDSEQSTRVNSKETDALWTEVTKKIERVNSMTMEVNKESRGAVNIRLIGVLNKAKNSLMAALTMLKQPTITWAIKKEVSKADLEADMALMSTRTELDETPIEVRLPNINIEDSQHKLQFKEEISAIVLELEKLERDVLSHVLSEPERSEMLKEVKDYKLKVETSDLLKKAKNPAEDLTNPDEWKKDIADLRSQTVGVIVKELEEYKTDNPSLFNLSKGSDVEEAANESELEPIIIPVAEEDDLPDLTDLAKSAMKPEDAAKVAPVKVEVAPSGGEEKKEEKAQFELSGEIKDLLEEAEMGDVENYGDELTTNATRHVHAKTKAGTIIAGSIGAVVLVIFLLVTISVVLTSKTNGKSRTGSEEEESLLGRSSVRSMRERAIMSEAPWLADYDYDGQAPQPRMSMDGNQRMSQMMAAQQGAQGQGYVYGSRGRLPPGTTASQ